MSEVHVRRIRSVLMSEFDGLIDSADVQHNPQSDVEQHFLTRSQAALTLSHAADIQKDVAASAIVDGFDDNGVDAIYFDEDAGEFYVVQSKWTEAGNKSPDAGSIAKFTSGFEDLLAGKFERFNPKVLEMKDSIERALDSYEVSFILIVAYTGTQQLSEHAERKLGDLLESYNGPTEIASYRTYSQKELYTAISGSIDNDSFKIDVTLRDWGQIREPFQAFYGQVSAEEIAHRYQEYNSRLFARNLRKFKGDTDVNRSMKATLVQESGKFWYFNNGITVLCNKIGRKAMGSGNREVGHFTCEGVSVVNGAQTVGNIASAVAQGFPKAKEATVLVRFISLENCPPDFAVDVTTATNTQNRIERRDFASLDPEQERLRKELMLDLSKTYIYKSGDSAPLREDGRTIDEATVALACAYPGIKLSADAKRNVSVLWQDIESPPYTLLFNSRLTAYRLWRCVEVARAVESVLAYERTRRIGEERRVAYHGNRFVLHWVFKQLPLDQFDELNVDLESIQEQARNQVPQFIDEIAATVKHRFQTLI